MNNVTVAIKQKIKSDLNSCVKYLCVKFRSQTNSQIVASVSRNIKPGHCNCGAGKKKNRKQKAKQMPQSAAKI